MARINSGLEKTVKIVLESEGITGFVQDYKFLDGIKYELDFAWPEYKFGIEIQGGQYLKKSGHSNIAGLERDYEKMNLAILNGWKVLQYPTSVLNKNPFLIAEQVKELLDWNIDWKPSGQVKFNGQEWVEVGKNVRKS